MKTYSIGEAAKLINVTAHTLRFYDKLGLLPNLRKNSVGLRRFTEEDVHWLFILQCLKETGLQLKDIKKYIDLAQKGEETLQERLEMFQQQKVRIERQIANLQRNIEKIDFKVRYYEEALKSGEANVYKNNKKLAEDKKRLFKIKA